MATKLNEIANYYKKSMNKKIVTPEEADAAILRETHGQEIPLSPELLDKADTAKAEALGATLNEDAEAERGDKLPGYKKGAIRKSKIK